MQHRLNDIIDTIKNRRGLTLAVKETRLSPERAKNSVLYFSDDAGRVKDVMTYPTDFSGQADIALNIVVMRTEYLQRIVTDAIAHNYTSMTRDIIARNISRANYRIYRYGGYSRNHLLCGLFTCILELAHDPRRQALFASKNVPSYKVRNSPPTYDRRNIGEVPLSRTLRHRGTAEDSVIFAA